MLNFACKTIFLAFSFISLFRRSDRESVSRPVYWRPASPSISTGVPITGHRPVPGLEFVPEPILSLDNDNLCRKPKPKAAYRLYGRYYWNWVEVLYIFIWKNNNRNYNRSTGLPRAVRFSINDRSIEGRPVYRYRPVYREPAVYR